MGLWRRVTNLFRGDGLTREIDEELEAHVADAIEAGRDPAEARRAFGSMLRTREESRDARLVAWLETLRADAVFGWRQLLKRKMTTAAAVVSLGLGIGACTSAFRLIDALLWRPLPVAHPERLYSVAFAGVGADGRGMTYDSCSYPMFGRMKAAVKEQAGVVAVSYAERIDLTYGGEQEIERAYRQFVSGMMFPSFGLRPALGRLLTESDDVTPGAHPVAVLSHDYWQRRFAGDTRVVGRTFRMGDTTYQIVGVSGAAFTGTETGTMTDVFVPMMMKTPRTLASYTNFWLRIFVELKPAVLAEPVHERLRATFRAIQEERAKGFTGMSKRRMDKFFAEKLLLEPAGAGRSNLQRDYRRALTALGILVLLVLGIACANVANLMTAQAAGRAREMALRISIGAGRWRLVQLVLVESGWVALLATAFGGLFAWWSAPFIVGMINPADNPARLALPADWRVLGFSLVVACVVTFLFGMAPAWRASAVRPASALKGGDDPLARHRSMHALIALQVAFCFVVQFVAGLFVTSFDRLTSQPTGFSAARILNLETVTQKPQLPVYWEQVAEHLRKVPGVEQVALTVWPLMSGESSNGVVSVNGGAASEAISDFLHISPRWLDTMRIPLRNGRDFTATDTFPAVAIVNEAFARQFYDGQDPTGKTFLSDDHRMTIVGLVRDARSRDDMRLAIRPTAFVPFHGTDGNGAPQPTGRGTFVVRTRSANPLALAGTLRREVPLARSEFRVRGIRTQEEINQACTLRERLLAVLALFFAAVALLLAGIGLYGVLDYGVVRRRREIGIRIAIGAQAGDIARGVTAGAFGMAMAGAITGCALGTAGVRTIASLLFGVQATDPAMMAVPWLTLGAATLVAALPAVIRAVRTDPVNMLRAD